jgi:hypothetical protein
MLDSTTPAPPFCQRQTPTPLSLPLLVAQTGIFYHVVRPRPLLLQTPLPQARPFNRAHAFEPTFPKSVRIASLPPDRTPSLNRADGLNAQPSSPETNGDSSDSRASSPAVLIQKPLGENGRPGRGGYSVSKVMHRHGWRLKELTSLKVSLCLSRRRTISYQRSGYRQQPCQRPSRRDPHHHSSK